jgi:hypothetical protein
LPSPPGDRSPRAARASVLEEGEEALGAGEAGRRDPRFAGGLFLKVFLPQLGGYLIKLA